MPEQRKTKLGAIGLTLGLVALMLILILTAVHGVGTDAALYYKLQSDAAILPGAGISDEALRDLDGRLADYLAGDAKALYDGEDVVEATIDGAVRPAFDERELAHLFDCYDLFALLRKVRTRLIPWAVLLIAGGAWLLGERKRIRRCALLSPLVLLVPLGAFGIWAAVDFDGAFTFFHRLLFSNDLWLLDPGTELLIRICPESMFMAMGLRIALWGLAALVAVPAITMLLTAIWPKGKEKEDNSWNGNRTTRRGAALRQKTFDFGERR